MDYRREGFALLLMRLGLSWFIFLWAAHKIIIPGQYQNLARHFDKVDLSIVQIYGIAGFQIMLCVLAAIGLFRLFSYGGLAMMHLFTVSRRWEGFFDPFALSERGFPIHRNQVIDLAVMAAFIAIILLIHRDHFSIGGWLNRQRGKQWWH